MKTRRKKNVLQAEKRNRLTPPSRKKIRHRGACRGTSAKYHDPKSDLEEAIQQYIDLYAFAPVAYVNFDRTGRIEKLNIAATQLFGRPRHVLIGCPLTAFVFPEDSLLFLNHLLRCRNAVNLVETDLRLKNATREILSVHLVSTPVLPTLHDGAAIYQTAIIDLTESKRAEETIRRSEKRYRTLFDLVPVAVYTCDANGLIEEFNQRTIDLWGRTPKSRNRADRFCGSPKIFYPDGRPMRHDQCPMARVLGGELLASDELEIIVEREDGSRRNVVAAPIALTDSEHRIVGAINCLHDITERKRHEAESARRAKLIDLSFEPILVWNFDEGIIEWNAGAESLYGYTRGEVLGRQPHELLKTVRAVPLRKFRDLLLRDGRWSGELRHTTKDGREIIADSRHQLVEIEGRKLVLETIRDITEQKALEQAAREQARQQAVLYHFLQRRHEAKSLADLYASGLDTIVETIGCDRASILILDEHGVMRFMAWRGLSEKYRKATEGHSPWAPNAVNPEPICISDIQKADLPRRLKAAIKREGINAAAFIPLTIGGRIAGKFMIYYGEPHEFAENELTIAINIGVQLAIGIERTRAGEALRESEDRLRTLANSVPQIIWTNDAKGKPTYFNDRWFEYSGLNYQESIHGDVEKLVHPDDAPTVQAKWQRALTAGQTFDCEYRLRRSDGEYRWFIGRNIPLKDEQGVLGWFGSATDIHDRKKAEYALTESEERFRLLVDGARDYAIFVINPSNVITHWNRGAERVFGWTAAEAIGKSGKLVFTPEDRKRKQEEHEIATAMRKGSASDRRWHLRKDGTRIWVDGVMHRLDDEHTGALRGFAKIARDATSERQAHDELERRVKERTAELIAANTKLKEEIETRSRLEQEILLISEREKRRIGQDLHDSLCQELAATAFFLETQALKLKQRRSTQSKLFSEAAQAVNANVGLARDLARGLHPIELSTAGLGNALRELCYRTNQSHKSVCRFIYPRAVRVGDDVVALNLYRIAQEAVNNATKHAEASEITMSLKRSDSRLHLQIQDNGSGFDGKHPGKGMGVDIMQHRANAIGAKLTVESAKGRGTTVTCMLPGD